MRNIPSHADTAGCAGFPCRLFILLWLMLAAWRAFAVSVDLDEVVLPVPDRSEEARREALAQGFEIFLVRLTGERDVARYAGMDALLAHPERYLQRFGYEQAAGSGGAPVLRLRMRFDREGVARVLRRQGLPLWGADRPVVVAWIAIDNGRGRFLLGDNPESALAQSLRQAADRRGLPLMLPLLDLQDRRAVSVADVWGGFLERVQAASRRYDEHPVVLAGRVRRSASGGWHGVWRLGYEGGQAEWEDSADRLGTLLVRAVEDTADRLALRLAFRTTGTREAIPVLFEGMDDLASHLRARKRLEALAPVRDVRERRLVSGEVEFEVEVEGGAEALRRALQRSGLEILEEAPLFRLRLQVPREPGT